MIFFFSGFPARFFSGFSAVLSYFSRLLFLLFGFFLSKFRSFHVSTVDYVFFDTFDSIKMIFIYISVSAATGSGSGMNLFVCPHVFFPFFTFLLI